MRTILRTPLLPDPSNLSLVMAAAMASNWSCDVNIFELIFEPQYTRGASHDMAWYKSTLR